MAWQEDLDRLRQGLGEFVNRSRRSRGELSRAMDRHPSYLGRMLRGKTPLRVEEVLHLLTVLDVAPYRLFYRFFPLAAPLEARLLEDHPWDALAAGGVPSDYLVKSARGAMGGPNPSSVAVAFRVGQMLAAKIRQSIFTQRQVAAAVGVSPRALSNALHRYGILTFEHVFRILEVLAVTPGRFFLELQTSVSGTVVDSLRLGEYLDTFERLRREEAGSLAARRHYRSPFPPLDDVGPGGEEEE